MHLLIEIGVTSLVNLDGFATVRADDFVDVLDRRKSTIYASVFSSRSLHVQCSQVRATSQQFALALCDSTAVFRAAAILSPIPRMYSFAAPVVAIC